MSNDDDEDANKICQACGGQVVEMGVLGSRRHSRCRSCGLDSSQASKPSRWDADDPRNPDRIHPEIIGALERYVSDGLPPGGFLEAVLSNDLMDACKRADLQSMHSLVAIVCYVYNKLPSPRHGSREIVQLWIDLGSAKRLGAPTEEIEQIASLIHAALERK